MPIKGFYHTGFVVKDLERSVAFYRDVIGLKEMGRVERIGGFAEKVVGYQGVHLKIAFMSFGQGHVLELIQYLNPRGKEGRPERNDVGATHVCFYVDNIEQVYQDLSRKGVRFLNPPAFLKQDGKVTRAAMYGQDPDGNWLEFLESPQ